MKLDITVNEEKTQVRVDVALPLIRRASESVVSLLTGDIQKMLHDEGHNVGRLLDSPALGRVGNDSQEFCEGSWVFGLRSESGRDLTQPTRVVAPPPPPVEEPSPRPRKQRKKRPIRNTKKEE